MKPGEGVQNGCAPFPPLSHILHSPVVGIDFFLFSLFIFLFAFNDVLHSFEDTTSLARVRLPQPNDCERDRESTFFSNASSLYVAKFHHSSPCEVFPYIVLPPLLANEFSNRCWENELERDGGGLLWEQHDFFASMAAANGGSDNLVKNLENFINYEDFSKFSIST